jgi:hypothetical protein
VKGMGKTGRGFEYVRNKFPNVSDTKIKEGIFTFAYTIFRCVNQLNVKVLVISVRTQLYNLQAFLFCH